MASKSQTKDGETSPGISDPESIEPTSTSSSLRSDEEQLLKKLYSLKRAPAEILGLSNIPETD